MKYDNLKKKDQKFSVGKLKSLWIFTGYKLLDKLNSLQNCVKVSRSGLFVVSFFFFYNIFLIFEKNLDMHLQIISIVFSLAKKKIANDRKNPTFFNCF